MASAAASGPAPGFARFWTVLGEARSLDVRPPTTWVVAVLAAFTVALVGALVARRNPPPTLIR
jgi:hypothetical protein